MVGYYSAIPLSLSTALANYQEVRAMPSKTPPGYQVRPPRRKVRIEQADIDTAKKANSTQCAIARAIYREIKGASHISVDVATVRFTQGDKRYYYMTPPDAQRFIINFDLGENGVEPFAMTLNSGTVHDVAKRPGVGGAPRGTRVAASNRVPARHRSPYYTNRRTYGARAMTGTPAAKRAQVHA